MVCVWGQVQVLLAQIDKAQMFPPRARAPIIPICPMMIIIPIIPICEAKGLSLSPS